MLTKDHLTLELMRLKPTDQWEPRPGGLVFFFVKGGAGKCVAGETIQDFRPGDMFVLEGSAEGKISVVPGQELVFWWFSVNLEHFFPLFHGTEISLLQNVFDGFRGIKFYPASKPVAEECQKLVLAVSPQFNLNHRCQVLHIAASVLATEFKLAQNQRVGFIGVEEHLTSVFEKLSADELLSLSVGDLAKRFGCSRRHLNRLFHHRFGFSVAALRMEMRLIKAASLLRSDNIKIINLAEQCGFNHMGLFNTCFKRRFGTTPSQWRNLLAKASAQPVNERGVDMECPMRSNGLCPWTGSEREVQSLRPLPGAKSGDTIAMVHSKAAGNRSNRNSIVKDSGPQNPRLPDQQGSGAQPRPPA